MPKNRNLESCAAMQPVTRRKVLGYLAKGTVAAGIAMVHGSHDEAAGQSGPPSVTSFGLIVYGGTPAGIMAALAAVRGGISVAIVEPTNHLGGILTSGLGQTDSQYMQCIGGLAAQFPRSTNEGSSAVARTAGTMQAARPTTAMIAAFAAKIRGSWAVMP